MWGLAGVEAELHDLDCDDGHHTEGVLHGSPGTSVTMNNVVSVLALFEQQQCNYEQSFDQVLL